MKTRCHLISSELHFILLQVHRNKTVQSINFNLSLRHSEYFSPRKKVFGYSLCHQLLIWTSSTLSLSIYLSLTPSLSSCSYLTIDRKVGIRTHIYLFSYKTQQKSKNILIECKQNKTKSNFKT